MPGICRSATTQPGPVAGRLSTNSEAEEKAFT